MIYNTIGERIKQKRIEKGMTVEELAKALGKNRATVYRYENNQIPSVPHSIIGKLADALDVSIAFLLGKEDDEAWTKTEYLADFIQFLLHDKEEYNIFISYLKSHDKDNLSFNIKKELIYKIIELTDEEIKQLDDILRIVMTSNKGDANNGKHTGETE